MAASNATVTALKSAFIQAQVNQILSKPVEPSARALRRPSEADPLPDRVIRDVTQKVNRRLQEHGRSAWSSIAVRKVAEQIDWVYWNSVVADAEADEHVDLTQALRQGDDLTLDRNVARLPDYIEDLSSELSKAESKELSAKVSRLEELTAHRETLLKTMAAYDELISLLKPFDQPQTSIQPNLVTRDGPLAAELTKLRTLSIRLAGRLADRAGTAGHQQDIDMLEEDEEEDTGDNGQDIWKDNDKKLSNLLASNAHPQ